MRTKDISYVSEEEGGGGQAQFSGHCEGSGLSAGVGDVDAQRGLHG
ncbi:hypothetical protein RI578_01245 [Streptomyces sp. BB1-1-1]|nr:hypothetical protein [Streptomyces sp. BB1-1-1]WND40550.1 hypothetical protein RI578_01245 [Streptomyces sp. BB1-1-1]